MKKAICMLLAAVLTLSLCACGAPETTIRKLEPAPAVSAPESAAASSGEPNGAPPAPEPDAPVQVENPAESGTVPSEAAEAASEETVEPEADESAVPPASESTETAAEPSDEDASEGASAPEETTAPAEQPGAPTSDTVSGAEAPVPARAEPADGSSTASPGGSGSGSGGSTSGSVTVPEPETGENLVWVPTNGGTKYHTYAGCSNMKNPIQVTLETAVANGFTPCKRCH